MLICLLNWRNAQDFWEAPAGTACDNAEQPYPVKADEFLRDVPAEDEDIVGIHCHPGARVIEFTDRMRVQTVCTSKHHVGRRAHV